MRRFKHHQDLPYKVWEHITTFLSSEETKRLLCVNRTLFAIAMNERYNTSTIETLSSRDTHRNLVRLCDPAVACRVHGLILSPGSICRAVQENNRRAVQEDAKKKSKIETVANFTNKIHKIIKASLLGKIMGLEVPAEVTAQNLLTIMGLLKELRSLEVYIHGSEHWYLQQAAIPFFPVGWSTFRTNLRSLELTVPVEDLVAVLPNLSHGILPNLDTISLRISRASTATQNDDIIMVETILPFLQSHRHTIRSLTFDNNHDMVRRINLSPVLLELHLSSLTHFTLTHSSHLTHFAITTGESPPFDIFDAAPRRRTYPFFSQECFATPLPQLEHLAIHYSSADEHEWEAQRNSMIPYIQQFRSTLVSLKLVSLDIYYRWTFESVRLLVEGFASSARLRRLDILVACFDPELLTILAANLPNLEVLNITTWSLSRWGRTSDLLMGPDVPLLALGTSALSFPQWRLRSLNLHIYGLDPGAINAAYYMERDLCKSALLETLPNVEVFWS
ncbi:hypothetical protein BJ912DRAFT_1061340 [Pholiota molesta]|nr:hypothetical protein BJ912DRAFT_1061340 [Pholiota molesta]